MFTTREDAKMSCLVEAQAVRRFSKATQKAMAEGRVGGAYHAFDTVKMARACAQKAHEALWELSQGELTEEEFEAFNLVEEVEQDYKQARACLV